jgi:hypothetical protein
MVASWSGGSGVVESPAEDDGSGICSRKSAPQLSQNACPDIT